MKNQSISKVTFLASSIMFTSCFSLSVQAFGLGDLGGGLGGGGGSTSSVDTRALVKTSLKMVKHYKLSMSAMNYAQAEALEAFGLGVEAEKALQAAKAYENGVTDPIDTEKEGKKIASSQKRTDLVNKEAKKQIKLEGTARTHLAKSAAMYAGASYAGIRIVKDLTNWAKNAKGAMKSMKSNPMGLVNLQNDIKPAMYVMSELPDLASRWTKTSSMLIDYAKINGDEIDAEKSEKIISKEIGLE